MRKFAIALCCILIIAGVFFWISQKPSQRILHPTTPHPCPELAAFICTDNPLEQMYPNQNACRLVHHIPEELRNLPFAMYPTDWEYDTLRFDFNKRFNKFPHAILAPRTNEELIQTLKLLRKYNLHFAIRGGGHSYETASLSQGYTIDLKNFDTLKLNTEQEEVYIGAGLRAGTVLEALGKADYTIPTGTCQSVGLMGLSMGGGIGMLLRQYGFTCDSIKSITILTADYQIIEVDETHQPDLFWALRGAGNGSFGIVLGMTLRMYHVPQATYFRMDWDWDAQTIPKIFEVWENWTKNLPSSITPQLRLWNAEGKPGITIIGLHIGSENEQNWEETFQELAPRLTRREGRFIDIAKNWTGVTSMPFCKAKSKILSQPLSSELVQKIIQFMQNYEGYYKYFEFGPFGGNIPQTNTAFYPRNAPGWWYMASYWNEQKEDSIALTALREFYQDISNLTSPYSYGNTVDYDLVSYLDAYYGDNVDRLIQIKQQYDPENVFHWQQSIPLSR